MPEENAKTTNFAGLAVYCLEFRRRAAIPWAASSREQAELGYVQAEGFVIRSERLSGFMKCLPGYRRINNRTTGGRIQIFAADEGTGDGVIPTDALIDELHRHKNLGLYRTWSGKLRKRGGQLATISTAGVPGSEFEEQREKLRQNLPVIEHRPGYVHTRSESVAFHEYALPEGGDVSDMAAVKLANPLRSITEASLTTKFASPTMTIHHWSRFTCNLATRSELAAIQEAEWHAAHSSDTIPEGTPVWLGLDVGWKWDTTAMVPLWWKAHEDRLLGPASILVPPRDGTSLDPALVERALVEIHDRNPIHTVVMDTSRAEQLATWIEQTFGVTVIDRAQTNAMAVEDYDRFMEALRSGWLHHTGDPGLTRHALNAIAKVLPMGDARFDRSSHTRQGGDQNARVIDALIAAAMANSQAAVQVEPEEEPIFEWA